jgi:hypothetical protein
MKVYGPFTDVCDAWTPEKTQPHSNANRFLHLQVASSDMKIIMIKFQFPQNFIGFAVNLPKHRLRQEMEEKI